MTALWRRCLIRLVNQSQKTPLARLDLSADQSRSGHELAIRAKRRLLKRRTTRVAIATRVVAPVNRIFMACPPGEFSVVIQRGHYAGVALALQGTIIVMPA